MYVYGCALGGFQMISRQRITGLCCTLLLTTAASWGAVPSDTNNDTSRPAAMSFKGKGNGPIQVIDVTGKVEYFTARDLPIIKRRTVAEPPAKTTVGIQPVSGQDPGIDAMLQTRPEKNPNRLSANGPASRPPKAREKE